MPRLLSLLIFLFPLLVAAQQSDSTSRNIIFFSPLKLIDPVNPGAEVSFERSHGRKWATHVAAAYGLQVTGVDRNVSGFRLQAEQKYFTRTTYARRRYFSAGLSYGNTKLTEKTHFYDHINQVGQSDTFAISRTNTSFNVKMGRQYFAGRFVFDIAIGAGVKHRRVTHEGRSIPYGSRHPNIIVSANDERNEITFNLPATFKIGYRF